MPRYRFHVAVGGELTAPSVHDAQVLVDEFVQAGNALPAQISFLDAEVHEATRSDYIQGLTDHTDQLSLFTVPVLTC